MPPIIEVNNIGKKYRITSNQGGYLTLRDSLTNAMKHPIKTMKGHFGKHEDFWALKDINFKVEQGETLGIIGHNGAGKSTLLKVLSQITPPTTGEIKLRGRVASLLEVGTGFNPELTGRENVFMNGAVLGMTKKEIEKKFDEIVDFAGVEKFLDVPVKRYSSGMLVRLGFAVAAHLEPDILIVDEVLAVGDAEFQKKCLGKMEEVTQKEGRTILFVSHNMGAVQRLCKQTILINNGVITSIGDTENVVLQYINNDGDSPSMITWEQGKVDKEKLVSLDSIELLNSNGESISTYRYGCRIHIKIHYHINESMIGLRVGIELRNSAGLLLFVSYNNDSLKNIQKKEPGMYEVECFIKSKHLVPGKYFISPSLNITKVKSLVVVDNALMFNLLPAHNIKTSQHNINQGVIIPEVYWR